MIVTMTKAEPKFIIVDGNAHVCRAYFGIQGLTDSQGRPCNAVYGFARILLYLVERYGPTHLAVTFDAASYRRKELYAGYKESRKQNKEGNEDLALQLPIAREMTEALGIKTIRQDGCEADDLMASLAKKAHAIKMPSLVFTHDKDLAQVVTEDDTIKMLKTYNTNKSDAILGWNEVKEEYGVYPNQIPHLLALMGDKSDDIPGVAGVGPKTASSLIEKYGTIKNVYHNLDDIKGKLKDKLIAGKEDVKLSFKLAILGRDQLADESVPEVSECEFKHFASSSREYFTQMGFNSLVGRV